MRTAVAVDLEIQVIRPSSGSRGRLSTAQESRPIELLLRRSVPSVVGHRRHSAAERNCSLARIPIANRALAAHQIAVAAAALRKAVLDSDSQTRVGA